MQKVYDQLAADLSEATVGPETIDVNLGLFGPWPVIYIYTRIIISTSWNIADDMPQEEEEFDPTSLHSMHKVGRCDEWHDAKVQVTQMN